MTFCDYNLFDLIHVVLAFGYVGIIIVLNHEVSAKLGHVGSFCADLTAPEV